MFAYRCLDCGKKHIREAPFTGPFEAPCLRCGRPVAVSEESVQLLAATATVPAASEAVTPAAPMAKCNPGVTATPPPQASSSAIRQKMGDPAARPGPAPASFPALEVMDAEDAPDEEAGEPEPKSAPEK